MFTLTVLAFATPGFAQVSFQPSIHSSPNIPTDIFQVKLSQVGKPDLITTQASSNMVSVFLNDGNGNFPAGPSATYLTGGVGVNSVVSADFDEDGSPDLATANCGNSPDPPQTPVPSSVSILFNNGDKTFKPHVDYPLPACPDSIGFLLAPSGNSLFSLVVSYGQSTLTILANDSFGTFSEHTITGPAGSILSGVSAADYNGDTLDDVAAVMSFPGNPVQQVVIFYQQGNGFGPATTVFSMQANLIAANTVGFNTTGRPDLLVPFTNAANEPPGVIAMANQGGGVFNSVKLHVDSRYLLGHKAAEGDLQGTGLHSIILPTTFLDSFNNLFGTFAVFFQTSKGAFLGPFYYAGDTFGSPGAVVVADFNGDGHTDFAAAGGEDEHLLVYRNNTSASTCSFFSNAGVHVCTPGSGGTASSPVAIAASGQGTPFPILAMKAYIDGKQVAENDFNTLNAAVSESTGTHQLAVNAWDPNDKVYQTIVNFTVGSACSPPSSAGVHICAPASGSTVSSPVAISAASNGGSAKISAMKAYIDGKQVASSTGAALTGSATEAAGSHQLVVNAWNTAGTLFQSIVNFSVK
ncbi:MAG TPA: FG-GAP-like repeat-containing protein [Candidatus Angelobacter sp.]|nr:FG-GAP-like repeat-containing protein [Candidatus Angelobacter sp.]